MSVKSEDTQSMQKALAEVGASKVGASKVEASTLPPAARVAYYDRYWDPRTRSNIYRKTKQDAESKHNQKINQKKPVLVVRRNLDERGRHTSTEIEIRSVGLSEVLLDICQDMETDLRLTPPTCNDKLLFYVYPDLCSLVHEYALEETKAAIVADINVAIDYIQTRLSSIFFNLKNLTSGDDPCITFDLLWALFRPGILVYNYHTYTQQPHVLQLRKFSVEREHSEVYGLLMCRIVKDDGEGFGLCDVGVKVTMFENTKKIRELAAYPLSFHEDCQGVRDMALKRGKVYASMTEETLHEIDGQGMCEVDTVKGSDIKKFTARGRVMIDASAFRAFNRNSEINRDISVPLKRDALTEEQYIICTPILLGFNFNSKKWGGFPLDRLRAVQWSKESFNSLVLDQSLKGLIHTLVRQYSSAEVSDFDDIVAGKGKGLIGMLAGPPGCGKTLTAEAVAEIARRPLYCISAGELGSEPSKVDEALEPILALAQRWKAVVLLDEADVFLAQRRENDIERNALVSIFLRKLEYYEGMMFLTTNLISQCDSAFESRIHFTVHYPMLSYSSRRQIWETFVVKTSGKDSLTSHDLDVLAKEEINGRQIKNIVSVANSFSKGEKVSLSMKHVRTVLAVMKDWKKARDAQSLIGIPGSQNSSATGSASVNLRSVVIFLILACLISHYIYLLCPQNFSNASSILRRP